MKVRFSFPVRGSLVVKQKEVVLDSFRFNFIANNERGVVDELVVEVMNVPQERWPRLDWQIGALGSRSQDFPFKVNENMFGFRDIRQELIRLEGLLSVYGLEEILFGELSVSWFLDDGDGDIAHGLLQDWKLSAPLERPREGYLEGEFIERLITASSSETDEISSLSLFRAARSHFQNQRYIDSIRAFYLFLEYLFAGGHTSKRQTVAAFQQNSVLIKAIEDMLQERDVQEKFYKVSNKYRAFSVGVSANSVCEFLFEIRGALQHANAFEMRKWHPSEHEELLTEAALFFELSHILSWEIAEKAASAIEPNG